MLAAAFASRYLWETVGGDEQRAVGDWQIAHVASLLGHRRPRARAGGSRPRSGRAERLDGLAARVLLRGDGPRRGGGGRPGAATAGPRLLARCSALDDEEDRELIGSQLASIPAVARCKGGAAAAGGHSISALDHVQVAMPVGLEAEAEAFYGGILASNAREAARARGTRRPLVRERDGQGSPRRRGGVPAGAQGPPRPRRRRPRRPRRGADESRSPGELDSELEGVRRCYVADPFGNRIELIEAQRS